MRKLTTLLLAAALCAAAAEPTLLKYAMPDSRVIFGVNVAQVRTSPLGKYLLGLVAQNPNPQFDQFIQASGFDPRQDLEEILFATSGTEQNSPKILLVRGKFDPSRIGGMARVAGVKVNPYKGIDLFTKGEKGSGPDMEMGFLDSTLAIGGDPATVRALIDRKGSMSTGPTGDLAARVTTVSAAQDIWFVSIIPAGEIASKIPNAQSSGFNAELVKSINQASGGLKFGDAVTLSIELGATTAQDATALSDVLKFLIGLGQSAKPQPGQEQFQELLKNISLNTEGTLVKLGLAVPETTIEALIEKGKK